MSVLYHYTCRHSAPRILGDGRIRPGVNMHGRDEWGARFAWFTDLTPPVPRQAVGLTSMTLKCDRTECVFTVDAAERCISRWVNVRRKHRMLWDLELADGVMPMHWFVSQHPVPIIAQLDCIDAHNQQAARY